MALLDLGHLAGHHSDQLDFGHCVNMKRSNLWLLVLQFDQSQHIHSSGHHYICDCHRQKSFESLVFHQLLLDPNYNYTKMIKRKKYQDSIK